MHLSTQKLIEEIHKSNLYGYFVENGGPCIVAELMKVSGASNTIKASKIPYSKEESEKYKYFGKFNRTVSKDYVDSILIAHGCDETNLTYASSFQLEKNTHGYVGIRRHNNTEYYHLSIHDSSLNRQQKIELLNETCIKLVHGRVTKDCCIDAVWFKNKEVCLDRTLQFISESNIFDNLCYIENGEILRLEDLLRKAHGKNLVIIKGSFNPIHEGHLSLVLELKKKYPNALYCFSISTNNFDKGQVDVRNLKQRVDLINKLGFGVLIYNHPLFEDLVKVLRNKSKEIQLKDVIFPIGADTWSRLRACYENEQEISDLESKFIVFSRGEERLEKPYISNVEFRDFGLKNSSSNIRKEKDFNWDTYSGKIIEWYQKHQ